MPSQSAKPRTAGSEAESSTKRRLARTWLHVCGCLALSVCLAGCTSFYPVEQTASAISRGIDPGDTVKLTTRDADEVTMVVWSVGDQEIRGRVQGDSREVVRIEFDRIAIIAVERLNFKRTIFATVVPAVIAAAIACNRQDCESHAVVTAAY
jgi:hypothetical protein